MMSSYNAHTETFVKNLKLLKIQDILTLQTLKIYHKFRTNKLPHYIPNLPLFKNSNIHNHNMHGANGYALHKNKCLHIFAQKSLKATSWSTNDDITDAHISATIQQILTKFSAAVTYVK